MMKMLRGKVIVRTQVRINLMTTFLSLISLNLFDQTFLELKLVAKNQHQMSQDPIREVTTVAEEVATRNPST